MLIPENDTQQLWELNGRVEALKAYVKHNKYPDTEVMLEMLGEPPLTEDDLPFA